MNKLRLYYFCLTLLLGYSTFGQYRHSYLQLGKREFRAENYIEAINFFTYYINDHPTIYEGYYLRGLAKYYVADLIGSEIDLTKAIQYLPEFPRIYLVRGVVRSENLKLKQSIDDFNTALQLDSTYTDAYYYRALNYLILHEYESSLADIEQVIESDTSYPNAYILRGVIHSQLNNYYEAILDFTHCLNRDPKNSRALVERGSVYAKLGNIEFAMADIDSALSIDSLNAYAYFQRGLMNIDIKDYENALKDLNRVIEISPENELAYFNRALITSNRNEDGQAIKDYLHILNQRPDNMLVYYNLGISFARLGHFEKAITCFNKAIELYPDYADAYYQRSLVKIEVGNIESAKQDMKNYESLNDKNMQKDDSTKFDEGLEILRLSHFSDDFIKEKEKKNKVQYIETEIYLQPIFQAVIDTENFLLQIESPEEKTIKYELKSIPCNPDYNIAKELIQNKIKILDSLIVKDEHEMNYYLKRGLLNKLLNNYSAAIHDLDKALSYEPKNVFILFSRANCRLALLQDLLDKNSFERGLPKHFNSQCLRLYSDILYDLYKILDINPVFLYARYNIGYSRFLMEDYSGALREFSVVCSKRKIAEAHFNKALLQIFLDEKEEGCVELGIAGELGLKEAYSVIRRLCR